MVWWWCMMVNQLIVSPCSQDTDPPSALTWYLLSWVEQPHFGLGCLLHHSACCNVLNDTADRRLMKSWAVYEGRSINKLQNGINLSIFKIWKIRNIGFVHNLILSSSSEFYYDRDIICKRQIWRCYHWNHFGKETAFWYSFSVGKRTLPECHSLLRYVQMTNVLQNQQYMFGVRSLLVDEKVLLMKRSGWCVVLMTDAAIAAVTFLIWYDWRVPISVQINLDNILKNKVLTFDI